jgi:hypothetical protein
MNLFDKNWKQKAELIKSALTIVDKLSKLDIEDVDDLEIIEELINKSKTLTKSTLWKLN